MRTVLILAVLAVVVMWALLVGGTIDDQPAIKPAPAIVHAASIFDPPPVIVTTSSTSTSTTTTTAVVAARARTAPTHPSTGNVWDRVAACESGGRWDDTRGGYFGGLHFMRDTWLRAGGGRFAPTANLATREQQITIAKAWLARTSVKQWPVCGPKVGLTMADAA